MRLQVFSKPSQKQIDQFGEENAKNHMQDNLAYSFKPNLEVVLAAIDYANNYRGPKTVIDPETARERGLPETTAVVPAEVGSTTARNTILQNTHLVGGELITTLNTEIRKACARIGIIPKTVSEDQWLDYLTKNRAEALTGYIGHVLLTPEKILVTGVGDVFVHVDGVRVVGKEKPIDGLKKTMIDQMASKLTIERQKIHELLNTPLTLMQFEYMQNNPRQGGTLAYSAIDGTETMDYDFHGFAAKSGDSILIYTDGLQPKNNDAASTMSNLKPVNPIFNEQTALHLSETDDWSVLQVETLEALEE